MLNKKELAALVGWTKKVQEIFNKSGVSDFGELRKCEKLAMLHALEGAGLEIRTDGDSDGTSEFVKIKDDTTVISVFFFSRALDMDYFNDGIYALQCNFDDKTYESDYDGSNMTFVEFVSFLDGLLHEEAAIVNLTPHAVTIFDSDGETVIKTIPSSGVARAEQKRKPIGDINGIPVSKSEYGKVEGLPPKEKNTIYIVSVLTAQAAKDRSDLYIVDDLVRDSSGQIMGCKALAQI